jgi:hypothetical protein
LSSLACLSFTGLKMMVDKDAERENDGEAMMSHWRINMNAFHNNNHSKYLILGHRLLSGNLINAEEYVFFSPS